MTLCLTQIEMQLRANAGHIRASGEGWTITLPLKITSEQHQSRDWGARYGRVEKEKAMVTNALWHRELITKQPKPKLPVVVTLTRIASRSLDEHDTLRYGFKGAADAIAAWLGVKDNDKRIMWQYAQEKPTKAMRAAAPLKLGPKGLKRASVYACRIRFETCTPHQESE